MIERLPASSMFAKRERNGVRKAEKKKRKKKEKEKDEERKYYMKADAQKK